MPSDKRPPWGKLGTQDCREPEGVLGLGACVNGKRHQGSRNTRELGYVRRMRLGSGAARAGNAEMNHERKETLRQD